MAALAIDLMIRKVTDVDVAPAAADVASSADTALAFDPGLPYAGTMAQMIDGSESIDWVSVLLSDFFHNGGYLIAVTGLA